MYSHIPFPIIVVSRTNELVVLSYMYQYIVSGGFPTCASHSTTTSVSSAILTGTLYENSTPLIVIIGLSVCAAREMSGLSTLRCTELKSVRLLDRMSLCHRTPFFLVDEY